MIQVEGLTKDFGFRRAIDSLTFEVDRGEIIGFLGPNGAGKTTTMRILCGYLPPTAGKAEIAGFDVVEDSLEVRRRVGYMPETVPLYPDMTVHEYLLYMARLRRLSNSEDRIDQVLDSVSMQERADGYISKLSKGMRQRVGLAQALLHEPEVLILDEPTIGLDPVQIVEVRNMIRELGKERTIMLSTHILSEAQQLCDRVLIINKGRIVAKDTTESLQARLTGAQRISLQVGGDSDDLEGVISQIPGVDQIHLIGGNSLEFQTVPGVDPRPEVARRLVESDYELLEMRRVGMSLEEIFVQLTRDETVPPEFIDYEVEPDEQEVG